MEQPWGRGRAACWSDPQHHPGLAKPFPVRAVCQGSWVWLWGCRGPSQGMKIKIWDSDVCGVGTATLTGLPRDPQRGEELVEHSKCSNGSRAEAWIRTG